MAPPRTLCLLGRPGRSSHCHTPQRGCVRSARSVWGTAPGRLGLVLRTPPAVQPALDEMLLGSCISGGYCHNKRREPCNVLAASFRRDAIGLLYLGWMWNNKHREPMYVQPALDVMILGPCTSDGYCHNKQSNTHIHCASNTTRFESKKCLI